jgi:hypothetical protein
VLTLLAGSTLDLVRVLLMLNSCRSARHRADVAVGVQAMRWEQSILPCFCTWMSWVRPPWPPLPSFTAVCILLCFVSLRLAHTQTRARKHARARTHTHTHAHTHTYAHAHTHTHKTLAQNTCCCFVGLVGVWNCIAASHQPLLSLTPALANKREPHPKRATSCPGEPDVGRGCLLGT